MAGAWAALVEASSSYKFRFYPSFEILLHLGGNSAPTPTRLTEESRGQCKNDFPFENSPLGLRPGQVRPKLHYLAHCIEELGITGENPRRTDLFGAEDYIGKVRGLRAIPSSGHTSLLLIYVFR